MTRSLNTRSFPNRPRDIQDFLQEYPHVQDDPSLIANVNFYLDKQAMRPDRRTYSQFMNDVEGDYEELEMNHSYIQWLFPIREHGVNPRAQPLQKHEAEAMSATPEILYRVLRSYIMMLDFYGIDFNGGHLQLTKDYEERFWNLSHASHNNLRLTRILKFLHEITPFQHHAAPLCLFFAAAHSEGLIDFISGQGGYSAGGSMDRWWSGCFRDDEERKEVGSILRSRGECGEGRWGWKEYNEWMEARREAGKIGWTGEDVLQEKDEGRSGEVENSQVDEDASGDDMELVDALLDLQLSGSTHGASPSKVKEIKDEPSDEETEVQPTKSSGRVTRSRSAKVSDSD